MIRLFERMLRWAGILLYWMHMHPLVIWLSRRRCRVLLYHACETNESDYIRDLRSNTTPARFDAHLEFLVRHYRVVPLHALERGAVGERAVVITFDDGYASVYANAFPRLKRRGLSATVYLTTDVVDNGALIWINELNWLLRNRPTAARPLAATAFDCAPHASIPTILERACEAYEPATVRQVLNEMRARAGLDGGSTADCARLYLTWEEVQEMARAGLTFGNHTAGHPNLARLSEAAQADEIGRAQDALASHVGRATSLAYPFGLHNTASRRVAAGLGFTSVMEVGGINDSPAVLDRVARVPVGAWSCAALFAELEIIAPVKARAHRLLGKYRRVRAACPPAGVGVPSPGRTRRG